MTVILALPFAKAVTVTSSPETVSVLLKEMMEELSTVQVILPPPRAVALILNVSSFFACTLVSERVIAESLMASFLG